MVYDDEITRQAEADFQEKLVAARAFAQNEMPRIHEAVVGLMEHMDAILEKPEPTPEDLALIEETEALLHGTLETVHYMKNIIGRNLIRMSTALYEGFRLEGANGNEKAQAIYEKLRPSYQAMLQAQLDQHQQ